MFLHIQKVSFAFGMDTFFKFTPSHLRNSFGASIMVSSILMFLPYQIPDLAISKNVESFTFTSLAYQSGYFHLNIVFTAFIFSPCFSGDSPSANIVLSISRSLPWNSARSPVRTSLLIFSICPPFLKLTFIPI